MGYSRVALVCSGYCQTQGVGSTADQHMAAPTGTPTFETSIVPPGATSALRFTSAGSAVYNDVYFPTGVRCITARFYFRFVGSLPSANLEIFRADATGSNGSIRFLVSSGTVVARAGGSASASLATVVADTWYYADFEWDVTVTANAFAKGRVDGGTVQTTGLDATTGGVDMSHLRIGVITASVTADVIIGRIVVAWTTDGTNAVDADFPLGLPASGGSTKGFSLTTTSGTHSSPGNFTLSSGGSPSNGDSSGGLVDEAPFDTSDYVEHTTAGGYWEGIYDSLGETATPLAVDQIVGVFASTTAANDQKSQLYDGTTATDAYPLTTVGTTSPNTRLFHEGWPLTPSGGSWSAGTLATLRLRWGFATDTNPLPRLAASLLEVELDDPPAASTVPGISMSNHSLH